MDAASGAPPSLGPRTSAGRSRSYPKPLLRLSLLLASVATITAGGNDDTYIATHVHEREGRRDCALVVPSIKSQAKEITRNFERVRHSNAMACTGKGNHKKF